MMSRIPEINKKPKNNKNDKFRWIDYQWEKMMEKIDRLEKEVLDLTIENAKLKDKLINYNHYTPTDGLEVGSPEDYEDNPQLNLFND
tara:strand:- start:427 stop:687 length:261 start_codon:yes stop_codon:yes gene_type:complete